MSREILENQNLNVIFGWELTDHKFKKRRSFTYNQNHANIETSKLTQHNPITVRYIKICCLAFLLENKDCGGLVYMIYQSILIELW